MQNLFLEDLKQVIDRANPNISVTENGAVGYETTGHALLDLNFELSSLRDASGPKIWREFLKAFNETPVAALLWLFFARDVREGCGERRTFRVIMSHLAQEYVMPTLRLLKYVPEYGRWDDLWDIVNESSSPAIRNEFIRIVRAQLIEDRDAMHNNQPVSLLAKWLPSANTSSPETRKRAIAFQKALGFSPRQYRRMLSALRRHIDVVERRMSARDWGNIRYPAVPSRAMLVYGNAFARHDPEGFKKYLSDVESGDSKINAGALFPHDIVHAYMSSPWEVKYELDRKLEAQWKALPDKIPDDKGTLVVVDGSGSMSARLGKTSISCHDVARALGIYFSERLRSSFRNSFVTFSEHPRLVTFDHGMTLRDKLDLINEYDECSNTNIEAVFDLVLKTAVDNHLKQSEIPASILIISDMEFDEATAYRYDADDSSLFSQIAKRWEAAGYKLPRLVFWNVCSRTGTIPVVTNELGVALVSGFSPNIADMVMSGRLDPLDCLMDKLLSDRYKPILEEVRSVYER